MNSFVLGLSPPQSVVNVDPSKQDWLNLLHVTASHRPAHLQRDSATILLQVGDVMPMQSFPSMWEMATIIVNKANYGLKDKETHHALKYVSMISTQSWMVTWSLPTTNSLP